MKYYAGIGSRETPKEILDWFKIVARYLEKNNYILRSGGAKGADQAFERGVFDDSMKEIYLPWGGFENNKSKLIVSDNENSKAYQIAQKYHPYWHNLKQGARKLQARNSHQGLGKDLNTPSDFVICWTRGGKGSGGTGQMIRLANDYNIPVFDAGKYNDLGEVKSDFKKFLIERGFEV